MRFRGALGTALLRCHALPQHHYGCIATSYTAKPYASLNSQTQKSPFGMQFAEEEGAIVALWRLTMTKKCAQTAAFERMSSNLFTLGGKKIDFDRHREKMAKKMGGNPFV